MIFSTTSQLNIFLIFVFYGIIAGFISSFISIIFLKNYQKKLIKSLFLVAFYSFFSIIFVFLINFFNFGKFSIVLLSAFILGFALTKSLFKKLVVILQNSWYNILIRRLNKVLNRFKKTKEKQKKNEITNQS